MLAVMHTATYDVPDRLRSCLALRLPKFGVFSWTNEYGIAFLTLLVGLR